VAALGVGAVVRVALALRGGVESGRAGAHAEQAAEHGLQPCPAVGGLAQQAGEAVE